eukprot:COSAG01_NODE_2309_length_7942_cov_7.425602_8_plen_68_part_00
MLSFYLAALRSYRAQPSYNAFKGLWRKRLASSQLGYWLPVRASERSPSDLPRSTDNRPAQLTIAPLN